MLSLKIYNGELFERTKRRYVGFALVMLSIIALSLFYKSGERLQGIIATVILLMIIGAYLFFLAKAGTETQMLIMPEGLQIGERLIPYALLRGFVVEMEKTTGKLKNIVLVFERTVEIFSLRDEASQQELFFAELSRRIPFLEHYEQSMVDRLMRKLKL